MNRRGFLKGLALATAATWLPHARAAGFAAAQERHPFLAGWASAPATGRPRVPLATEGRLPAGLSGTLYRNGPAMFERDGFRYRHWFDGDGCVHAWRLSPAGATHEARFVATPKFQAESRADRFLYMAAGTTVPDARAPGGPDGLSTANTAVIQHGGRLMALWEGGSAFALDPETLATRGPVTWRDDLAGVPFSAHALVDGNGTLWNFGHLPYVEDGVLVVWQVGADGSLVRAQPVPLGEAGYIHSFAMTEQHLVFVFAPWVLDRDRLGGNRSYFEALRWTPEQGCLAVVVRKDTLTESSRRRLPPGVVYHWGTAAEDAASIRMTGIWHDDGAGIMSPLAHYVAGEPERPVNDAPVRQVRVTLPKRGEPSVETLWRGQTEFPVPAGSDLICATTLDPTGPASYFNSISRFEANGSMADHYHYGTGVLVEEHRPTPDGKWLIGTLLDWERQRSGISVLAAHRLSDGPVFQAWAPYTVPLGFHGWWAGGSAS